jgi:hypothetical protein
LLVTAIGVARLAVATRATLAANRFHLGTQLTVVGMYVVGRGWMAVRVLRVGTTCVEREMRVLWWIADDAVVEMVKWVKRMSAQSMYPSCGRVAGGSLDE